MKKALLAVLIPSLLVGASSVSAFDLIKNDDIKLNFNGDIDLKSYVSMTDGDSNGTQTEVIFDDIDFDFTYKIDDSLSFYAGVDFTADGEGQIDNGESSETNDKEPILTDLVWVGFKTANYGSLQWGNLEMSFDPLGIDNSELDGGRASGDTDGGGTTHENAIKYDYVTGDLWLSATYAIPGEDNDDNKVTQFAWKYTPGDLQVNGGFGQTTEYVGGGDETEVAKATYFQAEVEYDFGDFTAAVLVSNEDEEIADIVTTGFEVDFTYQLTSKIKLAAGADFISQDIATNSSNDDYQYTYVAATYKFSKLVKVQYELARADGELQDFSDTSIDVYNNEIKTGILLNLQF